MKNDPLLEYQILILLPEAKDGDVINISIDIAATEERKVAIKKLMDEVWK